MSQRVSVLRQAATQRAYGAVTAQEPWKMTWPVFLGEDIEPHTKRGGELVELKIIARAGLHVVNELVIQAQVAWRGTGGPWRSRAVGRIRVRQALGHLDHLGANRELERELDA